jgi:branched-subunit amino acid ABC-type transport system permease component
MKRYGGKSERGWAVVIGGIGSLAVTGLGAVLFPALRRVDALSTESLMPSNIQQSIAEPVD